MSNLILILDDELNYAHMLRELLEENGYATDICGEPHLALERLQEKSYGLIISDFKMPECDGAEFILQLRKVLPHVPVVVISGLMGKPDLLKIANIGVELVLEKPFNVPAFLDFIGKYVQREVTHRATDEKNGTDLYAETPPEVGIDDYPKPLTCLADRSRLSRVFLSQLWKSVQSSLHTLLVIPPGGEVDLIAQETTVWLGYTASKPLHLSYGELNRPETLEKITALAGNGDSCVIVLTVPKGMDVVAADLNTFFRWSVNEVRGVECLRFIHALPDVVEVRQFSVQEDFGGAVSAVLHLPPFDERLVDLSFYAQAILDAMPPGRSKELMPEAARLLLHHRWKRNYAELQGSLYRASVYSGQGKISEAALATAIKEQRGGDPGKISNLSLETYLHAEQNRFLHQKLAKKNSLEARREIIGAKADRILCHQPLQEQPFFFEELLHEES